MTEKKNFYQIVRLENTWKNVDPEKEAVIGQRLVLVSERAATLFISQYIDDIEMFEYARYAIDPGENVIDLKDLRIIHPRILDSEGRPFAYQAGIRVFAAGFEEMTADSSMVPAFFLQV